MNTAAHDNEPLLLFLGLKKDKFHGVIFILQCQGLAE